MKSAGNCAWNCFAALAAVLAAVSPLGERHRAGVVPAVDHLRHAAHPRTFRERRVVGDRVDVRLVDVEIVGQVRASSPSLRPRLRCRVTPGLASSSS